MPTDVFGRGHVVISNRHAHEDVGMAPGARHSTRIILNYLYHNFAKSSSGVLAEPNIRNPRHIYPILL